jgi:transcriptional regulator with XRE-family HTH domain
MKKKVKLSYKFIVEKTDTGFSAYAEDSPVYSTGMNLTMLQEHLLEALELAHEESGEKISREQIVLEFDLQQFFRYYRVINARFLAERIGMNPTLLSQYVSGHKKPSPQQTARIIRGLNEVGRELSELKLI